MLVMGLDIATSSGVALVDPALRPLEWRCLSIEAEGDEPWDKAADLSSALGDLIGVNRPAFAVIERPISVVVDHGFRKRKPSDDSDKRMINAKTTITLAALAAAAVTTLESAGIAWAMISPATWRAAYYGKGYKPREDWKQAALDMARLHDVSLPNSIRAARDAAEAIGIATAWQRATFIPTRHQQAFMALRMDGHRRMA